MVQAQATARYVRTSAQKAGLVLDLIRGKSVPSALATLKFARKGVARDVLKVLQSAVANAQQKEGFGGEVERLFVSACFANQGPSQKRVRPAPMGRAFRVVKRTAHLTVAVTEKAAVVRTAPAPAAVPFTAAITGFRSARMLRITSHVIRVNSRRPSDLRLKSSPMIAFTSPPEQKPLPAPVITSARGSARVARYARKRRSSS